jgi:NAD(P)-dependent dehydrogenase (short-subunit alcohol dehydrogenase family)
MTVQRIESNTQRTVIVTGAQGVSGAAVLKTYAALPGTTVYGVSRRPVENDGNVPRLKRWASKTVRGSRKRPAPCAIWWRTICFSCWR